MRLEVGSRAQPLATPAAEPPGERIDVRLTWPDGSAGRGEAVAGEAGDGTPEAVVRAALDAYGAVIAAAADDAPHAELLAACEAERHCPPALAAVDLASWDRRGRVERSPVCRLLAPGAARVLFLSRPIAAVDRDGAARLASQAAAAGYIGVRVRVGLGDDAGRLGAVRAAAGPRMAIRAVAGEAWADAAEALANLRALVPSGIELVEAPVADRGELRRLHERAPIPLAVVAGAADTAARMAEAADAVSLQIPRCGGLSGLMRIAAEARSAGLHPYVAARAAGPLGVAAAMHAAAALAASGPVAPLELDPTGLRAAPDLRVDDGMLPVPAASGLLGDLPDR